MRLFQTWISGGASTRDTEKWEAVQAQWQRKIQSITNTKRWIKVADYAKERHQEDAMLEPASCWLEEPISELKGNFQISVYFRIVEVAKVGFPDLYESVLVLVDRKKQTYVNLCYKLPAYSPEEATEAFKSALSSERANQLALTLGDDMFVRSFAATMSPENLEKCLIAASFVSTRLRDASRTLFDELDGVGHQFAKIFEKWDGTDELAEAGKYGTVWRLKRLFHATEENPYPKGLGLRISATNGINVPAKRGRPKKGGRELVIAHLLALMWQRCGLGEPKLSAQSRFIRACSQVLPWHNIFKADTAQFMRGELAKKRRGDVVIG